MPAGEAFPSALVEPWTRGRRQIINTYGPTEASTDTSRQSLRPGEPITIGSPFANVTYVILEANQLQPLPHGEVGELCVGGVHVARGYRNLPDQTAQKFISHPQFGRLYRTGDKCKIDIQTQRVHFLGRIDAQLKVRGHRVEAQAVEDILQTQFTEIEAAVLDYQNETLVAFVAAPSICEGEISVVAPAPAEWAARVTAMLAKQLPAPSIPTRIFLVEKFVMQPVSGKIDRKCLPDLSHLPRNGEPEAEDTRSDTPASARDTGKGKSRCLMPMRAWTVNVRKCWRSAGPYSRRRWDWTMDSLRLAGTRSSLRAWRRNCEPQDGWCRSGRCSVTATLLEKWPYRPRVLQQASKAFTAPVKSDENSAERDEAAAEVLSIGYFTTLQVLFAIFLYSPLLVAFLSIVDFIEFGTIFTTASLWAFIIDGFFVYLLALVTPFASLLWVMTIKFFMGGDIHENNVTPGVYPKWSKMHLRIWCIDRLENMVLVPLRAMYRSAPLMAFVLRQLGATVGDNLQCAHDAELSGPLDLISIEGDVAISTGAYIQTTKWSGQHLHVGPVHLESGCKIGMRAAIANNVTVGRGAWITPLTPILANVGSQEIWEGAPARLSGRCTRAEAHGDRLPVRLSDLATGDPQRPYADIPILLAHCGSHRRDLLARPRLSARRRS